MRDHDGKGSCVGVYWRGASKDANYVSGSIPWEEKI